MIGSGGSPTTDETEHLCLISGAMRGCWIVVVAPTFVFGVVGVVGSGGGPRKPTGAETGRFWRAAENEHKCSNPVVVVTPKIKHSCLISRVLGVVDGDGSGAGPEKAHSLQKRARMLDFGAC